MQYNIVRNGDAVNVTVFADGQMYVADQTHPNIKRIVEAVSNGVQNVANLFDSTNTINRALKPYNVEVRGGSVYHNNEKVDNSITRAILRISRTGQAYDGLARFLDNVMQNPSAHSREQLYDWLRDRNFTLTSDGCFIAYKGVSPDMRSISSGVASVNGIEHRGNIPNNVGDVITMPRSDVQHDPSVGCHQGLHVGTWEYASNFGTGPTLKIKVNPADVVSVPTDCSWQKMRVCRYEVLEVIDAPVDDVYDDSVELEESEYSFDFDTGVESDLVDETEVRGDSGSIYTVATWQDADGTLNKECTCKGYEFTGHCKHLSWV